MYRDLSDHIDSLLYPDLIEYGSMSEGLSKALKAIGSKFVVDNAAVSIPHARISYGVRFTQLYLAASERMFIVEFMEPGVLHGIGLTSRLEDAAQAIHLWLSSLVSITVMKERLDFVRPRDEHLAIEAKKAVERQWDILLAFWRKIEIDGDLMSPAPLIEAAMKRHELRRLFPVTSHYNLCFSTTIEYPFSRDCPHAVAIGDGRFRAYSTRSKNIDVVRDDDSIYTEVVYETIGTGSAKEVADMLVVNLPFECGPARYTIWPQRDFKQNGE